MVTSAREIPTNTSSKTIRIKAGFWLYLKVDADPSLPNRNALQHFIRMRTMPVHAAARRADSKAILGQIDERRNSFEHRFLVNLKQRRVAFEAAREDVEFFEAVRAENLLDLLFVLRTVDKKILKIPATSSKPGVPSEDNAILGF